MGLFKPAWLSNNEDKAIKAVDAVDDFETLAMVVREARYESVQIRAIDRIDDTVYLAKCASDPRSSGQVALAALAKLTDQRQMAENAINNLSRVKKAALDRISDPEWLDYVVNNSNDSYIRGIASDRLADASINKATTQADFAEIALNAHMPASFGMKAVRQLTDQDLLTTVLCGCFNKMVSDEAFDRLVGQKNLVRVAVEGKVFDTRKKAVEKLSDQALLFEVATKAGENCVGGDGAFLRMAAVEKLTNPIALAKVAMNDLDSKVHMAAAKKLNDKTVLIEADNDALRVLAVEGLTDETLLKEIALKDSSYLVQDAAKKRLKPFEEKRLAGATDEKEYSELATTAFDPEIRLAAVKQVTDQSVLFDIVVEKNDEWLGSSEGKLFAQIRKEALERLNDEEILLKVAQRSLDMVNRRPEYEQAVRKLKPFEEARLTEAISQEHFAKLAMTALNEDVRAEATAQLTDGTLLCDVAITSKYAQTARLAINQITDQSLLSRIAIEGSNNTVVEAAIERINDQKLLYEVAKSLDFEREYRKDTRSRFEAVKRITDRTLLSMLQKESHDADVRVYCCKALGTHDHFNFQYGTPCAHCGCALAFYNDDSHTTYWYIR
jgi:hypothetical protein